LQDFAAARARLQRSAPDDITTLQGGAQAAAPCRAVRKQPLSAGGGKRTTAQKNLDGNQTLERRRQSLGSRPQ